MVFVWAVNYFCFSTFKCPEPGLYTAAPTGSLSFNFDDEEEDENDDEDSDSEIKSSTKELSVDISVFKKFKKNPNVDTSFLPDTRRDVSKYRWWFQRA